MKEGAVKEVFGFRGTGVIWLKLSPTAAPVEDLQDEYSAKAFQTPEKTWIGVYLPQAGNTVVVDSLPPEEVKLLQSCAVGVK